MSKISILLIERDAILSNLNKFYLEAEGYKVAIAKSYDQTLKQLNEFSIDLIIFDMAMEKENGGIQLLEEAKTRNPSISFIITGFTGQQLEVEILRGGAIEYVYKPYRQIELISRVKYVLERIDLNKEIIRLKSEIKTLQENLKAGKEPGNSGVSLYKENPLNGKSLAALSHDLKELLRKFLIYGDQLSETVSNLDDQSWDTLMKTRNSAQNMLRMIERLIDYAMISKISIGFQKVNMNHVINEIIQDLEMPVLKDKAEIKLENLPTLEADPLLMRQLFQNLIGNALKFQKRGEAPAITVSRSKDAREKYEIIVEDNGIGFDAKYAEQIFKPFIRLHSDNSYEGTGLGLTIAKKIVDRHSGEIKVKSKIGRGTTFTITLPENQSDMN